jgi:peptidoglycan/xylan/chitin deacetylase (PgdA/CDA1 family)
MNWQLLGVMFLVLIIALILVGVVIFYIRHWASRGQAAAQSGDGYEGNYFVRYLPAQQKALVDAGNNGKPAPAGKRTSLQYLLTAIFVLGVAGALIAAFYGNRDRLAAPIDLTDQEQQALSAYSYQWKRHETQQLLSLPQQVAYLKKQGMVLVYDHAALAWMHNGRSPTQIALSQWRKFANSYQVKSVDCAWKQLAECHKRNPHGLYVILPGHWSVQQIDGLLDRGGKVLAYGSPQQVFQAGNVPFTLDGLAFSPTVTADMQDIALVGDRELTLGLDAGLVLSVQPAFPDYQASSARPQGIAINDDHIAGGQGSTRLFAHARGKNGRLVWMDFSPNADDHAPEINQAYFQATLAAIFRYLEGKPYASWGMWPSGAPFAALMEEDTEDQFGNAEAVAKFFQAKHYPITWYMLSNEAQQHRELTRLLAATGQVACHGDNHQSFTRNDLETQQLRLARCKKVLETLTGKPVLTFRPPEERHNNDTLSALLNNGMTHLITHIERDRFVPSVYATQDGQHSLVNIPRMSTDDYVLWDDYKLSDSESIKQLKQETDWIKQVGGLLMFSFHTQFMGDEAHLQTVEALADYIHDSTAYFATANDIAGWWRLRQRLLENSPVTEQDLQAFKPVHLQVGSDGKLTQQPVTDTNIFSTLKHKEPQ